MGAPERFESERRNKKGKNIMVIVPARFIDDQCIYGRGTCTNRTGDVFVYHCAEHEGQTDGLRQCAYDDGMGGGCENVTGNAEEARFYKYCEIHDNGYADADGQDWFADAGHNEDDTTESQ